MHDKGSYRVVIRCGMIEYCLSSLNATHGDWVHVKVQVKVQVNGCISRLWRASQGQGQDHSPLVVVFSRSGQWPASVPSLPQPVCWQMGLVPAPSPPAFLLLFYGRPSTVNMVDPTSHSVHRTNAGVYVYIQPTQEATHSDRNISVVYLGLVSEKRD